VREDARSKGTRLLVEGRVVLTSVRPAEVAATVRGEGTMYQAGWSPSTDWWCTCPARGTCSHLWALKRVVAVDLVAS
jgi:uncharacterized Zn finger protein